MAYLRQMDNRRRSKRLGAAFSVSVSLHLLLLVALGSSLPGGAWRGTPSPPLMVRVLDALAPEAASPETVAAAAAAATAPAAVPVPPAASAAEASAAPAERPSASPASGEPAPARPRQAAPEPAGDYLPADDVDQLPRAKGATSLVGLRIVEHRVPVRIWIDSAGRVTRIEWGRTELAPEALEALEKTLASWRFEPARNDDGAVGVRLAIRLCFDRNGGLHAPDGDCWNPAAPR